MKTIDTVNLPRVGLQVLVIKDGKILIGKDAKKGENVYGVPAGHWENNETLVEGAKREVFEESGITCENLEIVSVYDFFREDKGIRYVSIGFVGEYGSGELQDNSEEGRLDWKWMNPADALLLHLYPAGKVLIEKYMSNTKPL